MTFQLDLKDKFANTHKENRLRRQQEQPWSVKGQGMFWNWYNWSVEDSLPYQRIAWFTEQVSGRDRVKQKLELSCAWSIVFSLLFSNTHTDARMHTHTRSNLNALFPSLELSFDQPHQPTLIFPLKHLPLSSEDCPQWTWKRSGAQRRLTHYNVWSQPDICLGPECLGPNSVMLLM